MRLPFPKSPSNLPPRRAQSLSLSFVREGWLAKGGIRLSWSVREDEGRVAATTAAGFLLPSCCNGTRTGWDWSLIARGVVSRTRVGYIEIATNDRVRSCPGEPARNPRLPQREEDPLLPTGRGIKGERCLKPPSIYRAFRGVGMGKD